MNVGFAMPQFGALAHDPTNIARFATEVEQAGATSLWVADRLLAPVHPTIGYNGTDSVPEQFRSALDPFVLLTVAATATEGVRIGTSTMNAPWYSPALLARALTGIDQISGGRLVCGFGIGWSPEEYQGAGVDWATRGARLDEALSVLEAFWAGGTVEHHGRFFTIPATHQQIVPTQRPRPPIYLGGFSEPAFRRIGRRAEGWLPGWEVHDPMPIEQYQASWARIRQFAQEAGRDPDALNQILRLNVTEPDTTAAAIAEAVGTTTSTISPQETFVDLNYQASTVDEAIEQAGAVLDLVARG